MKNYSDHVMKVAAEQGINISELVDQVKINNWIQMMPKWMGEDAVKTPISPIMMCWQGMFILENISTEKEKEMRVQQYDAAVLLLRAALLGSKDAVHFIVEEIDARGLAFLTKGISPEILTQWAKDGSSEHTAEINSMLIKTYGGLSSNQHKYRIKNKSIYCWMCVYELQSEGDSCLCFYHKNISLSSHGDDDEMKLCVKCDRYLCDMHWQNSDCVALFSSSHYRELKKCSGVFHKL